MAISRVRLLHTHPTPSNTPVTGSLFGYVGQNFQNLLPVSPCAVITDGTHNTDVPLRTIIRAITHTHTFVNLWGVVKFIRKTPYSAAMRICGNVELRFVFRRHNFCDSSSCEGRLWLIKKRVSLAGWPDDLVKNTSGLRYDWREGGAVLHCHCWE